MYVSPFDHKLRSIIEPSLDALGYTLVIVRLSEGAKRKALQIIAERKDEVPMSFDDCEQITHTASALLDVEDPIHGAYELEVSSPGLERPLVALKDFVRFIGSEAKVEMQLPVNGRKRFKGVIEGVKDDTVHLNTEDGIQELSFDGMKGAKLVLTDALMKAFLKQAKG